MTQTKYEKLILITGAVFLFLMIGACLFFALRGNTNIYHDTADIAEASVLQININTADKETLKTLPDITDGIAENIIQYRLENGAFQNTEDIVRIKGVSEELYQFIKIYITV